MIDYDELQHRLIVLVDGRLAPGFAIGHLVNQMRYLDVAVEDYDVASTELREAGDAWSLVLARFENLAEAVEAGSREREAVRVAGLRFHYRVDCAYAAARRVLDRLVVVAHELLPRTQTDLGNSHDGFGPRLVRRCGELGLAVPESVLAQIDDLTSRIKSVRDQIEHPQSPLSVRWIQAGGELTVGTRKVVRVGEEPMPIQFEPACTLRNAIHAYVNAIIDLLETSCRSTA